MKKGNVRRKKRLMRYAILADVLLIFAISYSLAYFTSFDEVTGRFIAKNMNIALYENRYSSLTPEQRSTLISNRLLPKDPRIQNIEQTDVFVFMKVTVPVYASTNVEEDGTVHESRHLQEIFWLKTAQTVNEQTTSFHTKENDSDKEYWVELPAFEEGTDHQSAARTYIFGYSVYLRSYELTETLFDYIQLKNIRQFEIDPSDMLEVTVDAYGIQADSLDGIEKDSGSEKRVMTQEQLSRIYGYVQENEHSESNSG